MSGVLTPTVTLGVNFQGLDNVSTNLGSIPDTDGAVGPGTFVEFINGAFAVYNQSGNLLQSMTSDAFWTAAGVTPVFPFDPRILFDPVSGRWIATSADSEVATRATSARSVENVGPNPRLDGVLPASVPGWQRLAGLPNPRHQPGLFISANSFGYGHQIVITVPKADLLQATPTVANATFFFSPGETSSDVQPTVAYHSSGSEAIAHISSNYYQSTSALRANHIPHAGYDRPGFRSSERLAVWEPSAGAAAGGREHRDLHPVGRPVHVERSVAEWQPVRGAHRPRRRPRRRPVVRDREPVGLAHSARKRDHPAARTLRLQPLDGRQLAWRGGHRLYRLGSHRICKRLRGRGHAGQQHDRLRQPNAASPR